MNLGVISDVHGNLPALETALAALEAEGVEEILCCGDVVGYGPWPNECVALVRERCATCVRGNHDGAAVGALELARFSGAAAQALRWTRDQLTPSSREFLGACPLKTVHQGFFLTHASPRDPVWEYLTDRRAAWVSFRHFKAPLGWFGHSHLPTAFVEADGEVGGGRLAGPQSFTLEPGKRYLINPGSVGQPRDGDWRLSFGVYQRDGGGARVTIHRLQYEVERVAPAVRAANLPPSLYNRLPLGR